MPVNITKMHAREILDSRGNPTVEVELTDHLGNIARASVPSGASVGSKEALEIRDGGTRYLGKGVTTAVRKINTIISRHCGVFGSQEQFDEYLIAVDGTPNKSNMGANSILACSMAFARLDAMVKKHLLFEVLPFKRKRVEMPRPMINILNGGVHANNGLAIQEFMIIPNRFDDVRNALQISSEIFHALKSILHKKDLGTGVGDEGGFAPKLKSTTDALDLISEAIGAAGYILGKDVSLALDCAASEFYVDGKYNIEGQALPYEKLLSFYEKLVEKYPIVSIEDPFHEADFSAWKDMTRYLGKQIQIVGDDIFVTNVKYLQEGIEKGLANAILIKLNQIGTVTETIAAIELAESNNYNTIVSHRSGETEDSFISHLAVASPGYQIKTGSVCRSDRIAKYNELLRIQEYLVEKNL